MTLAQMTLPLQTVRLQQQRRFRRGMDAGYLWDEVQGRMLERMHWVKQQPSRVLVVGDGNSRDALSLKKAYPSSSIVVMDWSWAKDATTASSLEQATSSHRSGGLNWAKQALRRLTSTQQAQGNAVQKPGDDLLRLSADAHQIPLRSGHFDLLWSNGLLHWSTQWPSLLGELRRCAREQALFSFSLLGVDSFSDLRPLVPELMTFPDMHDLGDALVHAGWAEPVVDMDRIRLTWTHPQALLRDLRALGGHVSAYRAKALRSRRWLASVHAALEQLRRGEGQLELEVELILGHAWRAPDPVQSGPWQPIHFRP